MKIFKICLIGVISIVVLFLLFRTTEVKVTYYGTELSSSAPVSNSLMIGSGKAMRTAASVDSYDMVTFNGAVENDYGSEERYKESHYYKTETEQFDKTIEQITNTIKELKGTIKNNDTHSNIRREFDKEYNPRYQYLVFTIDNSIENTEKIEEVLKQYGEIRTSEDTKTSVEQETIDINNKISELEASLKQLQRTTKSAEEASRVARQIEQYKNKLSGLEKKVTYKTYTIDIYEIINIKVNSLIYWYSTNWNIKDKVDSCLMIAFSLLLIGGIITLFAIIIIGKITSENKKNFDHKIEELKKLNKQISLNIKL